MEFNPVIIKENPGLCRCCLSEGCYKDLGSEYTWMGETEIYAEMLLDCFDIGISQHSAGPNGPNRLICEVCITRLRDACNFKKQVIDSEKKFIDMLSKGELRPKVVVMLPGNVKEEPATEYIENIECEYLEEGNLNDDNADDDMGMDDEEDHLPLALQSTSKQEVTAVALPTKRSRGRPRNPLNKEKKLKLTDKKPKVTGKKLKAIKTEDKDKAKTSKGDKTTKPAASRRRKNLQILFNNTTIIPFKFRGQFRCFYCDESIKDGMVLRKHTFTHGRVSAKHKAFIMQKKLLELKLDVSEMNCKLCEERFKSFDVIVDHLIDSHKLSYDKTVPMLLCCYRLVDLKCLHCDATFNYFRLLVSHVNNMHPESNLPCEHCGRMFNKMADLLCHIRNYHREGGFNCDVCNKECNSNVSLRAHMRVHHRNLTKLEIELGITDENYTVEADREDLQKRKDKAKQNRENLAYVINMTTALPFRFFKNQYRCFYCNNMFHDCDELRLHTTNVHPNFDPKSKVTKAVKGSELSIKMDIINLTCKVCGVRIDDFDLMIDHIIVNHDAKYDKSLTELLQPFKLSTQNMECPVCKLNTFDHFTVLLRHLYKEHPSNNFICPYCGLSMMTKHNLRTHINRHHSDKVFDCDLCDFRVDTGFKLREHKAKQHGIKFFQCKRCPENFITHNAKLRHMVDIHHVGYKCNYCNKLFTKYHAVKSHTRRTHLKEKNVACTICNAMFYDKWLLKVHMVKHVGERNFHCDVCSKSFVWKKNLRGHMVTHHKQYVNDLQTNKSYENVKLE